MLFTNRLDSIASFAVDLLVRSAWFLLVTAIRRASCLLSSAVGLNVSRLSPPVVTNLSVYVVSVVQIGLKPLFPTACCVKRVDVVDRSLLEGHAVRGQWQSSLLGTLGSEAGLPRLVTKIFSSSSAFSVVLQLVHFSFFARLAVAPFIGASCQQIPQQQTGPIIPSRNRANIFRHNPRNIYTNAPLEIQTAQQPIIRHQSKQTFFRSSVLTATNEVPPF